MTASLCMSSSLGSYVEYQHQMLIGGEAVRRVSEGDPFDGISALLKKPLGSSGPVAQ